MSKEFIYSKTPKSIISDALTFHKKPKKSDLFSAIRDAVLDESIPENLAKDLLAYFKPALPKKPKTIHQWLGLAAAKSDYRRFMNYIYVDAQRRAFASDGHRVHKAELPSFEPGYYDCSTGLPVEFDDCYSDIGRLFANFTPFANPIELSVELIGELQCDVISSSSSIDIVIRKIGDQWYDQKYLLDAIALANSKAVGICNGGAVDCLLIENDFGQALIAPIKNPNEA